MNRRSFLQHAGALSALSAVSSTADSDEKVEKPNVKPNVLFIMADDFNTAVSGYGHPQCKTPNLDRLAEQGTSFTRAYCQFPLCGPSRCSIMSGQYPLTNGVKGNGSELPADAKTLPYCFRENGYWTGRVSKIYHMGVPGHIFTGDNGIDHEASWDERYNVSVMETITPGKAEDLMLEDSTHLYEQLREEWKAYQHKGGKFMIPEGNHQGSDIVAVEASVGDDFMPDGIAAAKAIELLRERAKEGQPFFLGVGFVRPHMPSVAPKEAFDGYIAEEMQLPELIDGDLEDIPAAAQQNTNENKYKLSTENQKKALRAYYATVTYMDQQVGRLLDEVDALGIRDETIIVFVSDHGFHLGEHTMWQKMSLMEESIRVPLIVSSPYQETKNTKCDSIVELIDIFPTLMELAGLDAPTHLQGNSFAQLLDDPDAQHEKKDALIQVGNSFCMRIDKWAYMQYRNQNDKIIGTMLYDMENDPMQYRNLFGHPEYEALVRVLQRRLASRIQMAKDLRMD